MPRSYETRCKQDSYRIAKAYNKLRLSDFTDKDYRRYHNIVKNTGIPSEKLSKIEVEVHRVDGNIRPIDVYHFWSV